MELSGKVAVVTGGASGIGAACSRVLAREGAEVHILDSKGAVPADVTREEEVRSAMEACGAVDILVNCAGVAAREPVHAAADADWTRVLDVNLRGAYLCSKHALPYLRKRGGSIVHISSVVGLTGVRNRAAYSASKGALIALMRNMALDYAPDGVRVNCVCPGFVRTPFTAPLFADPDRAARVTALHPLGRLGEPDDVAEAVLFLVSSRASWITGQALAVDGGFTAGIHADI